MRAAARAKRLGPPRRRQPPAQPEAESKPVKAHAPLSSVLKSFKVRLAGGPALAPTAKAFKSYAEICASILRLCRDTAAVAASAPAASSSELRLALSLHAYALRSGLTADGSVASHLLTVYAAFACAADRDRAFGDCVAAGAASSFTYDFMVRQYVKAEDIASARRLFDEMPERSVVSYTTMVDALMKRGSVRDAVELYHQCPLRSVPFFTAMIAGFVRNELHEDALAVFHEMLNCSVSPNEITLLCVIMACIGAGGFDLAMSVVGLAIKSSLFEKNLGMHNCLITLYLRKGDTGAARRVFDEMEVRDVVSWTALLDVYAELGDLDGARQVLDAMPERNEVSWGTLIARHEQKGNAEEALNLYSQMLDDGCTPNISCFSSVLSACASLQDLRTGTRIHVHTLKMGCSSNVFVSSALIDMYCKCKKLPDAQRIFHSLPQKNIVCWNSLISGYSYNAKMVEADELFKKMPSRNAASWNSIISGQIPGEITFSSVLLACANLCSLQMGDLESSKRIFNEMPKRNGIAWTAMIQGLAENGLAKESIMLFEDMMAAGIAPNEYTFLAILFACSHGGLLEHAIHYFGTMQEYESGTLQVSTATWILEGYMYAYILATDGELTLLYRMSFRFQTVICWLTKGATDTGFDRWQVIDLPSCCVVGGGDPPSVSTKTRRPHRQQARDRELSFGAGRCGGPAVMEPLEVAITVIFDALLLVFMLKLFFAMFQMKLVVILFYLVVLLFAMAISGRTPSSF
ncbi:hypothetical protein GUJ93_ZPchr0013g36931 [Zizania palustris]|uniref:Pentatricopeptide repeat-containing protein n=1 Tax=Zizania palustris TaxID=103762 RepID=A0A8J5WYH6_ZIZPA|nr:hypothetical protein GUJ93_ZPchr0013g36931 [Zizania palustris]